MRCVLRKFTECFVTVNAWTACSSLPSPFSCCVLHGLFPSASTSPQDDYIPIGDLGQRDDKEYSSCTFSDMASRHGSEQRRPRFKFFFHKDSPPFTTIFSSHIMSPSGPAFSQLELTPGTTFLCPSRVMFLDHLMRRRRRRNGLPLQHRNQQSICSEPDVSSAVQYVTRTAT